MPGLSASRWAAPGLATATYYSSISDRPARLDGFDSRTAITATPTTAASATSVAARTTVAPQPPGGFVRDVPDGHARAPLDELTRYTKIVRRLKWKLPYLASGYRQAVDCLGPDPAQAAQAAEAELMFKLDFFEYYMLLERALVHLLGVFGTSVSRGFAGRHLPPTTTTKPMTRTLSGSRWAARNGHLPNGHQNGDGGLPRAPHRYHANVLEALDNPDSPLHPVLGFGEVRRQLGRAKDLRNRWKNADNDSAGSVACKAAGPPPLESYDPERILTTIFDGLDRAFAIAEQFVLRDKAATRDGSGGSNGGEDMAAVTDQEMRDAFSDCVGRIVTEEEQWEFMVDAMDWEAV